MNKFTKLFSTVALLAATPLAFACDYPQRPEIPEGGTASKDEMIAASKLVKSFQTEMIAYRECIDTQGAAKLQEFDEADEEGIANHHAAQTKKYNASVEDEELIVAQFNESVRAYKAQSE